jgi:hypothetical protein
MVRKRGDEKSFSKHVVEIRVDEKAFMTKMIGIR